VVAALSRRSRFVSRVRAFVSEREVSFGWTVVVVPIPIGVVLALGSYTGNVLPWLNAQFSLGWFCVFSLAVVGFAAGYVATESPPRLKAREARPVLIRRLGGTRVFALGLFCCCFYFLKVLSGFVHDQGLSRREGLATWWGIPFTLCLWTLAAVEFANETERSGSGEPADPERQWRWFAALRRKSAARWLAYFFLFGGTVASSVIALWPGLAWGVVNKPIPAWRGYGYKPVVPFFAAFVCWAGVLLVAAFLFLVHSFRARPAGLPQPVLRRAWYSLWAAGALAVLMLLVGAAGLGWLSEPLVDDVIAFYVLGFVLMLVEASAATRDRHFRSSLRRRTIGAVETIGFAVGIALISGLPEFRARLLAATVAGGIPLAQPTFRSLFGIDRQARGEVDAKSLDSVQKLEPLVLSVDERLALNGLLLEEPATTALPEAATLGRWKDCLTALAEAPLPSIRNMPKGEGRGNSDSDTRTGRSVGSSGVVVLGSLGGAPAVARLRGRLGGREAGSRECGAPPPAACASADGKAAALREARPGAPCGCEPAVAAGSVGGVSGVAADAVALAS